MVTRRGVFISEAVAGKKKAGWQRLNGVSPYEYPTLGDEHIIAKGGVKLRLEDKKVYPLQDAMKKFGEDIANVRFDHRLGLITFEMESDDRLSGRLLALVGANMAVFLKPFSIRKPEDHLRAVMGGSSRLRK